MIRLISIFILVFTASTTAAGSELKNVLITAAFEAGWESMDISKTSDKGYSSLILESESGMLSISRFASSGDAAARLESVAGTPSSFRQHPSREVQLNTISYSISWQSGTYVFVAASANNVNQVAEIFYKGLDQAGIITPSGSTNVAAKTIALPVDTIVSRSAAITVLDVNGRIITVEISCSGLQTKLLLHGQISSLESGKVLQIIPVLLPPDGKSSLKFVKPFEDWPEGKYKVSILVNEDEIGTKLFSIP